ncbi:hypothetical protein SPOG_04079 [Schizosaccharomyces cryophilus OY26]|uniref:Uncharacterized protein n=1 Tax=Schizosaccharomyces cryophilus (strain OY26 / ATCC MYA-4695 / CBS 11777 / NBRC 106824 / NRRL Y48691) TaxID=653667 RepID=S9XKE4_SCHCR|nr:uncharacterized protein SPOG_04079 [Schizosaccharomyces cryophilus OY26]EPY54186.1 hypothetical protein SPOG_04079 [Schizosaccharomyces cryophilus OY26]
MCGIHLKKKGNRSNLRKRIPERNPPNETDDESANNAPNVRSILENAKRKRTRLSAPGVNASNLVEGRKKEIKDSSEELNFEVPANEDPVQDSVFKDARLPTVEDRFAKPTNEIDVNLHLVSYIESKMNQDRQGSHHYEKNEKISNEVIPKNDTSHEDSSSIVLGLTNERKKNPAALGAIQEVDVGITSTNLESSRASKSKQKRKGTSKANTAPRRSSEDLARDRLIEDMLKSSAHSTDLEEGLYRRFR